MPPKPDAGAPVDALPVVAPTAVEEANTSWLPESLARAVTLFSRYGFLQIDKALRPELAEGVGRVYVDRYSEESEAQLAETSLHVGDRRFMVTVDLEPPFSDPALTANPFVLPVVDAVLGGHSLIASMGAVVALAGAGDQHVHRDHPPLFPETSLDPILPCYALTVVVPLVDLDRMTVGTTAIWLGSHRTAPSNRRASETEAPFLPAPRLGSVYLMDYRLLHGGTANRSSRARPILYTVYAREWFIDAPNFTRQPTLRATAAGLAHLSEAHRRLFSRVWPSGPSEAPTPTSRV